MTSGRVDPPKSAVYDRITRKIAADIRPFPERRAANKKDGIGRGRTELILFFEICDFISKWLGQALTANDNGAGQ